MSVKKSKKKKDFTLMSNYHLRDKELSLKAKGLLSVMLSLPKDWNYSASGLSSISCDGIRATRSALKELEIKGYLSRTPIRKNGKISDWEYIIKEKPLERFVLVENQQVENQQVENDPQLNTNKSITKELNIKEIKERKEGSANCPSFDSIIDSFRDEKVKEALRRFIKMRFANNKPLNSEIFQMLVDQLRELAFDDEDRLHIINTAVLNGWNSFRKVEKPPIILRPKNDDEVVTKRREDFSEEKLIALMRKLRGEAGEA